MTNPWTLLGGLALVAVVFVLAPVVGGVYAQFRVKRWLRCPETRIPACVGLDARYAALTAAFRQPLLRIKSCSLWPRRAGCAQRCCSLPEVSGDGDALRQTSLH